MLKVPWISVDNKLPRMEGGLSQPVLVVCREFGQEPAMAIARCWLSSLEGQKPIWYLDQDFYHLGRPHPIVEIVTHWAPMPRLPA